MLKKIFQTTVIIFLLFALGSQSIVAQETTKSPALKTLIQQIDEYYVSGEFYDEINSMEKLAIIYPQIYFTFLGTAMNKQANYINNQIASENFKNLNQEIVSLLPNFENVTSQNNTPTNVKELERVYSNAFNGKINKGFNQFYKNVTGKDVSQISIPSVLDQKIVDRTSSSLITKESISNQYPKKEARSNLNRASSLKISSLYYEPNPLLTNKAFDFVCKLKADIPEMGNRTIPVIFYFKVYVDSKVVFTSKEYIVDARNNTNKEWTQHMNPFSKTGIYVFEAFINYNNLSDRKSINVTVE